MYVSKRKKRGRPPAPPERAKSQQINVRVTASLRADLDAAAAKSRRNLSDEIANRLSESLTRADDWRPFGSRENYAACRLIAEFMQVLRHETGESWIRDAWAKEQLKAGISTILDLIGPSEMPERPEVSGLSPEEVDETGARLAQILVAVMKNSQASTRLLSHLASDLRLHSRREPGLGDLFSAFVKGKR